MQGGGERRGRTVGPVFGLEKLPGDDAGEVAPAVDADDEGALGLVRR